MYSSMKRSRIDIERSPLFRRPANDAALMLACLLPACAAPQSREPMPFQTAPAFSVAQGVERAERWWEDFNDDRLSDHVERGLRSNLTLRTAYERLSEALTVARQEESLKFPTVDGVAGGSVRRESSMDELREVSIGLEAAYELDLWGRIRSGIEARQLEAGATLEDYQAAAVSLSAEITRVLYRLTEATAQLKLLDSQLQTNRNVLTVIEERFAIGQSGSADVLRQRQLVEATLEQSVVTRASIEVLEHQLAVLLGMPPQGDVAAERPGALPDVPSIPEVGLPSDLLRRRPDVRAAFLRLEAADADVAAAVRDQYPSISLGASLATVAESPSGLFSSWLTSVSGQLLAPIVDGGRRRQEVRRTEAVRRQRLAEYGDAVLVAFQDVEDALAQERHQVTRIASLERQRELVTSTYRELRNQYLNGAADFIDVLVALRDQQEIERSILAARLLRIEYRIALHRAIAGGLSHLAMPISREDVTDVGDERLKGSQ